jgi:hypothetical protein
VLDVPYVPKISFFFSESKYIISDFKRLKNIFWPTNECARTHYVANAGAKIQPFFGLAIAFARFFETMKIDYYRNALQILFLYHKHGTKQYKIAVFVVTLRSGRTRLSATLVERLQVSLRPTRLHDNCKRKIYK